MKYKLNKKKILIESNKIRSDLRYSKMDIEQRKFLRSFLKKHKKLIWAFMAFIILEVIITLALPLISNVYLERSFEIINYKALLAFSGLLLGLIALFLINGYFRIYYSEKLSIYLINDIRDAWYKYFIKQPHLNSTKNSLNGQRLITKFVYHVQLLKMGIQKVLSEGIYGILLFIAILIFSFLFNSKLFLLLWVGTPVLLIVFIVSDYIGRYYVSKEQTFNTRIVNHLGDSFLNFEVFKSQKREKEKIDELNELIELDTFFRIRRQLWIQYSNRVLYSMVLLTGVLFYFIQLVWPFMEVTSLTSIATSGIIIGYFIKVLFSCAHVGIFYEAFRLGIRLSVPSFHVLENIPDRKTLNWDTIRIHSKKTKISRYGGYIKDLDIGINRGDRFLFVSKDTYGKTTLAEILTGLKSHQSIFFTVNKKRIKSRNWGKHVKDSVFITNNTSFNICLSDYLFGKNKSKITNKELNFALIELKKFKIFDFLLDNTEVFGRKIVNLNLSQTEIVLLQIAHCILVPKSLIVIDHNVVDCVNKQIKKGLDILEKNQKEAAIFIFSSKETDIYNFNKKYDILKDGIKEV